MMDIFHTNQAFHTYGTNTSRKNGYFVPEEPYSAEKKIEIASMIEKYGLLASSASKNLITNKIAAEGKVSISFVGKIYNRLCLARHKSQELGRGTHSLTEADEHCLAHLYRLHPFREVQSYVDNLYLITGTLAHSSAIFNFFQPLRVLVPSFPSSSSSSSGGAVYQDENFPPITNQMQTMQPQEKMPDLSMISCFSRCGISSFRDGNKKRTLALSAIRRPEEDCDSDRPRVRRRLDSDTPSLDSETDDDSTMQLAQSATSTATTTTSLVVYQPPSFLAGMVNAPNKPPVVDGPSEWVPRPPPALYHGGSGNPQSPSFSNH